jgi:hypothetical protein
VVPGEPLRRPDFPARKRRSGSGPTLDNFTGTLHDDGFFGVSAASLGDLDGDGVGDLTVGVPRDDDGGAPPAGTRGVAWVLFLDGVPACPGDLDGDGDTDLADLGILLADFGCEP